MSQRTALRRAMVEPGEELLRFAGFDATVRWRRSVRARRVSLRVDTRSGAVVVTLPPRAPRQVGMALLRQHSVWLMGRIAALPHAIRLDASASIPLGGVPHSVRHMPAGRGGAWVEAGEIVVSGGAEFIARRIADFMRAEARRRLTALAEEISTDTLVPRRISIKDTHTRWGSCNATGTLMFNWRLVMAPAPVQHYVVAHEVAHLRFMDHGPAFWALVRRLTAHEAFAEDWLRRHGASLLRVG